jgi:hypothetical protein
VGVRLTVISSRGVACRGVAWRGVWEAVNLTVVVGGVFLCVCRCVIPVSFPVSHVSVVVRGTGPDLGGGGVGWVTQLWCSGVHCVASRVD